MKKVNYSEFVERYFDCPYCCALISDKENVCTDDIVEDNELTCPNCKKKMIVGRCL